MLQRLISKNWLRLTLIFVAAFGISFGAASAVRILFFPPPDAEAEPEPTLLEVIEEPVIMQIPEFVSLQALVDNWVAELDSTASVGVSLYDLDHEQSAATYNSETILSSVALSELMTEYLSDNVMSETNTIDQLIEQLDLSNTSDDAAYSNADDASTFLQFLWQQSANATIYQKTSLETLTDGSPVYSRLGFVTTTPNNHHYALVLLGNLTDEVAQQLGEAIEQEFQGSTEEVL